MLASTPPSPRTPSKSNIKISEEEAVSMFGVDGSRFIEDLMRTDPAIVEGIAKSGSLESLLGSVYSPFRMASPRNFGSTSPWRTPDGKGHFRFPVSPTMEPGMVRRSARLTPSSAAAWTSDPSEVRPSKRRRGDGSPSPFRKSLQMGNEKGGMPLSSPHDFESFVMGSQALPMTPFLGESPGEAGRNVKARILQSEKRKPAVSKRGEYKCGKCGFYPKKQKHDCAAYKALQESQGGNSGVPPSQNTPTAAPPPTFRLDDAIKPVQI